MVTMIQQRLIGIPKTKQYIYCYHLPIFTVTLATFARQYLQVPQTAAIE